MAKVLQNIFISGSAGSGDEIVQGYAINSWHVSQSVDALTGIDAYDINISGSLTTTGPLTVIGSIFQNPGNVTPASATDNVIFIDLNTGKFTVGNKLPEITGSVLYTASISNDVITFTKGDGSQFSLTVNNVNNAVSASYAGTSSFATLTQTLVSNQNVGGISSGDTFTAGSSIEALLRDMLISYIEPVISNLFIKLGGSNISTAVRDVGNPFTCNSASFTATVDSPDGNYPVSASITSSGADIGTQQIYLSNTVSGTNNFSLGSTLTINKASSAGSVLFTVNTKSQTTVDTQSTSTSFAFYWRNYLAASSTIITNDSTAQTVIDSGTVTSTLTTSKSWTATCDSNNANLSNYTYIIYPATYGDLSNVIQNGSLPVLTAFTKLGDYTIANAYSSSTSFRVYKSNQPGAFAAGVTLTIS
jgi:hypothetical protein